MDTVETNNSGNDIVLILFSSKTGKKNSQANGCRSRTQWSKRNLSFTPVLNQIQGEEGCEYSFSYCILHILLRKLHDAFCVYGPIKSV